jgi:hypothetical protein
MFAGLDRAILYEDMPAVDSLTNLIHAIYVARERRAHDLEEDLTYLILQLYRSPQSLINWTGNWLDLPRPEPDQVV